MDGATYIQGKSSLLSYISGYTLEDILYLLSILKVHKVGNKNNYLKSIPYQCDTQTYHFQSIVFHP